MVGAGEGMTNSDASDKAADAGLRPLSACVAGAGLMTLGVLQFLGNVWSEIPEAARQELLIATRVAFIGFLFTLAALVLAWLGQQAGGAMWRGATSLFGLIAFAGSAYIVALGTSRALGMAMPTDSAALPGGEVLFFVGAGAAALLLLAAILTLMALRLLLGRKMP